MTVCRVLGADLDIRVRWHGEGLDRLLDAEHAELVNRIVKLLRGEGWQVAVEVSFNVYGERGSVDVIGWKPEARALLIGEAKSVIPDAQAMISGHDRKVRLAPGIVEGRGWVPAVVGRLLVVRDSSASRQRVADLGEVFGVAYPDRAVAVRRWLRQPSGPLSGLVFLRIDRGVSSMQRTVGRQRVRRSRRHDPGA
ncbi:MAG: hypothetical protein L0227_12470 [Chloroflexi bacterium]|nr:hypothetical protein [Chloroflexota bacterium]